MPKKQSNTWTVLKSGVRKNGNWYASEYPTGWYFVFGKSSDNYGEHHVDYKCLGPFKSYEAGLKVWEKEQ
jgi:hypothetical protein